MRQEGTVQASLFDLLAGHEVGRELSTMSGGPDDEADGPIGRTAR